MANPHRGGVSLQAGGATYTLSFSVNALCELEAQMGGTPMPKIAASLQSADGVSMSMVRTLVWAALRDHHRDVDERGAGDIVSDAGIEPVMEAIGEAFQLAFPQGGGDARPQKAKGRSR